MKHLRLASLETGSSAPAEETHPDSPTKSRSKGLFMTMLGAFCFALVPIWVRSIEAYSSMGIVFFRALFGVLLLSFWILRTAEGRREATLARLDRKQRLVLFCVGLSMCGTATTYYLGIMKTSVAKAVVLHYTAPIYVAILSPLLLREKNAPLTWFAVCAGLLGIALIAEPSSLIWGGRDELLGIASAFISGICLAGVFLFGRFLAGGLSSPVCTLWGSLIVLLALLPWGVSVPEGYFWQNLPFLGLLGTISLVLPYILFFQGQKHITAQNASMAALFEPVCGIAIGLLFFGERLTLLGSLGAAMVLFSIYLASCR
jgi:drug/metabolite transporter (DMT)-like permease